MKKITILFFLFLFVNQKANAQSYAPVATTGYSYDAIAENTTAISTTSGPLDGVNVLYSVAHAVLIGSSYGLPNNGTLSSGTKTFQLQSYAAPNMLFIQHATLDSLTLVTPAAYQNLSLLDFATDAFSPTSMSVTVRFTDNSTEVFSSITVYDWLSTVQAPFASGFDRMNRSAGTAANEGGQGNPRFFATDLAISCANQSKLVKRIIIKNTGTGTEKVCILALSGAAIPLTANASPNNLCSTGGSSTITAVGLSTFTWLPTGNFTGSNAATISVTPTVTTIYTVQAAGSQTCMFTAMVTVNVQTALPTLTLTNTSNAGGICPTKTINLTASGANTYTWVGGAITITNGVPFAPATSGDYTVTGENACGTSSAVTSVSIHPLPTILPSASSPTLCSGLTVTLTATGTGTNYAWSGHTSAISNGVGFAPVLTATYTVTGTSALSCTASATQVVTVVTTPTIAPVASPILVCIGGSSTLTATGATNYTWTSSSQTVYTSSLVATPSTTGLSTYTVTKANSNCTDTKVISIVTNSLPTVFAIVTPTLVCALNPATLAVGGGQSYTWTASGIPTTTFTGASPVVYPSAPSVYTVAASDGTCISRITVSLSVDPNPTILTSAMNSSAICSGQSVTVSATGGINYTVTSTSGINSNTSSVTETPTTTVAYTFTGDNSFGCTSSAAQIIVVNPNPTITVAANRTLVCSAGPSTLTASGANNYTWTSNNVLTNTTVVNPVNPLSGPVIYTAMGSYSTGCTSSKTIAINVFVPVLTVSGATTTCPGGQVSLSAGGGNNGTYSWNTGTGTPVNFQNLTTTLSAAAVFTLTASSTSITANCPATKTVAVGVYASPVIAAVAQRTAICTKESVELYGQGGVSYVWSNSASTTTITVSPLLQTTYTVTGTDANGCVNTGTVLIKVSNCVGISELDHSENSLLVYPNPNAGEFNIRATESMELVLTNELGQTIRLISLSGSNDYKIYINDLSKGVYFISGEKDNLRIHQKIIVAK